jgi:hypothetical protein
MDSDYEMVMPFWIDTEAYTARDKQMFVCGVEFEMLRQELMAGIPVVRTIHSENESRARMMASRLGRKVELEPSGVEGWTYLKTTDGCGGG